ncbi:MAG: ABC transporter substrate-binding protein, partial [Pseudomonadota bacterium]|nr:ABC transporter substrate-binding protein [Pseudomonadota bacterium]
MIFTKRNGQPMPSHLLHHADKVRRGGIDRREFLALASAFGATSATAHAMLGLATPAAAQAAPKQGGTVRIQQEVRALKDPRLFDWPQIANFTRGWLETLITYESNGTFKPALLESWEISDDAKTYTLFVRKEVTWNNGAAITAEDVARNIRGWCDRDMAGNSMAGRFATLIDPNTNQALDGAIEVVDSHTVRLNLPKPDISLIPGMADYPAAIVPDGFDATTMLENPIGTGPYLPESLIPGEKGVLVRNVNHRWWNEGNGAWLDQIEFLDFGTDPAAWARAARDGDIDMTYSVDGEYADLIGSFDGWTKHDVISMATVVVRPNQTV